MARPATLQQIDRTYVRFGRRKLSFFSGCDYFRLASHPAVMKAVQTGVRQFGLNVAASRLTSGNHIVYEQLERALAAFFDAEMALLVSTGYLTNLVVAQALARAFSHALLDERTHPSLCNAARFLDCPVLKFKHRDPQDLERSARRCGPGAKLIVLTDGMYSHNGGAAPLDQYLAVLPRDAIILVDDAHAAGVLGRTGKGSLELAAVKRNRIIQTITLSKAFGSYGGAILGAAPLRDRIFDHSSLFTGSTPLPLPLACAALQAVKTLKSDPTLRCRLHSNATCVKDALRQISRPEFSGLTTPGPIVALLPRGKAHVENIKGLLLAAGIYPPFIRYPGGPAGGYFRFAISSEHTRNQLNRLISTLSRAATRE